MAVIMPRHTRINIHIALSFSFLSLCYFAEVSRLIVDAKRSGRVPPTQLSE